MTKIAVFGGKGRIGRAALTMLRDAGLEANGFEPEDVTSKVFDDHDVYLAAVPYEACEEIAWEATSRAGKLYLDFTEDVEAGKAIRALARNTTAIVVPHCGVAPGAVSIIANELIPAERVSMRVGALPVHPVGRLKYALNWSTDGLVNEYIKKPIGIRNGRAVQLEPMGDYVELAKPFDSFPGFEAFNTSGGIGTFAETRGSWCGNASYQTIRYKGHCEYMRFLLDDLEYKYDAAALVELLDCVLPKNTSDLVEIQVFADVIGYKRTVYPDGRFSAIQLTTAGAAVAVLQWILDNREQAEKLVRDGNWIANEDIPLAGVEQYRCWSDTFGIFLRGGHGAR